MHDISKTILASFLIFVDFNLFFKYKLYYATRNEFEFFNICDIILYWRKNFLKNLNTNMINANRR